MENISEMLKGIDNIYLIFITLSMILVIFIIVYTITGNFAIGFASTIPVFVLDFLMEGLFMPMWISISIIMAMLIFSGWSYYLSHSNINTTTKNDDASIDYDNED